MPLDSKLQRKRLANDTYKDDMSADKTESPLNTLVPVLAASAGLYAMYKKGMLQPLVKSGMEVFETIAKKNTDKAYMNLKSIKEWTKFENLSPDKLKEIGYRIPKDSIFRGKGINKLKSLGLDTMSEIEKGDIRLGYARKIINDTIEDVNQLKRLIEENTKRVDAYKQKYYDSDLITGMKELRKFSREVNANNSNARLFVNEKAAQEFISMHTLSQEEEKRLLKINGYRPVMLQDIMDAPEKVQFDEGSKYIYKAKEGSKINLQDNTGTQKYNSADELLNIMSSSDFRYMNKSGKSTNMIGDWENTKRLILDKNILIDESGNLIDLRMSDEMLKDIKESITKDFQIPGLGFNPLASLFPSWTKAKNRKPNFGILSKDSIQPFITGEAGQKFLGKDLFVLNGKAFKVTEDGLEQVADNIVLNDISRANQYGLNKKMETIRKMANLKYYDFKLKDNIQQEIDSGSLKGKFYNYLDKANKWLDSGKPDNYIHKARFNPDGERIDIDNEWAFNPDIDSFLTNKIHKLTSKLNMYESIDIKTPENIFGNGPKDIVNEITNSTESSRKFIATRRGMSILSLKEQEGIENKISFTKDYLGQIFAGRNKDNTISDLTTETSLRAYGLFDNVFGRLNAIAPQLGFSTESKGSLPEYIKNMALKRVLPIYAVTQVPEMLNALSEPIFNLFDDDEDGTGNKNNITKFTMSNIVKPLDLGMHKVKDILGITKLNKKIEEFTPGFDQINELPGIYHLGLNQTYKERKDYIENGYDPIRKARYWGMGNCVIPEQDIQCGYGVTKKAKDIQINDLVITHEGILKPVLHVFTRQMKNNEWTPEIELYTTIFNNVTTDNHPYLAVKEKQCPSSSFKDCHPNRNSNTCKKCVYKACKEKNIWNPEWTLARDLKVGDYLAYPRIKILDIQKDINSLPANNEIGYLLGIFLAEGNIHTWHKNGKTYGIELTLNNAEINIANKVKDILNKYFPNTNTSINFTKNSGNGVITIRNLSTKVSEWFRSVLYQDREKHFIPNIYYYNKDFILSVITGLFDGDGHFSYKSNSLQLAYTSHRVEYVIQIRNLLYTLGYANSIIHCDKKLNGKKYTGYRLFITGDNAVKLNKELDLYKTKSYTFNLSNINDKYTIIDDNYIYLKIKSIDDNGYRGIVYDYEIKDSHSFCSLSTIMHNTPFTGGKIMYWRPNLYRRIEADVDFSDSKWGSRQEYYSNTWYPNPVNPLAPINHFILDKNHYDKKHYQDRPYLLTSKEGNNIPIIGPLYSATVGNIINPQKRMHEEYWKDNKPIEKNDENVAIVDYVNQATLYQKQMASNNAFINSNTITNINNSYKQSQTKDGYARAVSSKQAQEVVQYNSSPQNIISGNILPTQTDNTFSSFVGNLSNLEIYTTPSGSTSLVDIPDTLTTWDANQRLREYSIKRFPEADSRVDLKDENKFNPQLADYTNEKINNAFIYNVGEEFNTLADFFGMKGFETQAFITGEANVGAKTIEDSNYAYSFNKSFWDENLGGFGGDASEIFRRFVQKRNTGTEYINPIRNTMPSYMPGCFIAGTKVFIENKVNNIENLQIGQKVYDHNGKLQTIEYVHQGQYDGDMISIKAKGICNTITATGNHPFYVMTSNYCTYAHSHKRMCIPGIHPNNNKPCNYCKNKQWNFFEWKEARELKEGDYLAIAIPKNNHSINELIIPNSSRKMVKDISGKHIPLDFNFGIFTGFYLSEGHADKYRITFGSGKCEPEQIESVKYIGNLLGLTTSSFDVYDENGIGCIVTDIHSKQLSDLMKENFGHLSFNKTLPDWIFNAPIEYQMGIIAGMIQGDGSVGTKLSLTLTSVSYSLLQNTLLILAQNNMCSTIKSKVNNYEHIQYTLSISQKDAVTLKKLTHSYGTKILQIPDEYPKCTGCSSVIYNGYLLRKIDKIEKYNDTVTVYNLQVANSHTYNVEGVSVHNSNYFTDFLHGDAYCLSKDTLVLTDKGYIEAENVKIGDIILTNKGNHYPVQNIAIRPIETNEKSYRLTISGIDKKIPLEFSENHPILVKHLFRGIPYGGKCKPCLKDCKYNCNNCKSNKWNKTLLEFVKAKDIKIGDAVVFPIPVIDNPIINLDYQYEWQDAPRSPKYIKKGSLTITKDIAWLLGLYLAEGSTAKQNHRPVRLLFTIHSSEIEVADKVCNILENTFGKRPKITFRKEYDCLEIVLCDAQIARIFNDIIPGNLYEKRIPKEFYHSTKENMINLLLGFMLGDGSIQRNYVIGTTANQQLAFDLHRLSMYAGIPCQIIERNTRESYEICIHSFNLKDIDLSGLMYKQDKLDFNYTRIPGLLTYTDGQYIYSEITDKQEINLDYVYGFEVDIDDTFCVIGFATHNTKIDNGEERLPGEGYERLAGINTKKLFELGIGSSYIGKSKEDIQKHLLNQDTMDSFGIEVTESGTKMHDQIEKAWLESGLAINTEGKIEDKQNNILGYYDALIHDPTSKTGKAIVDIKTVGDKKFNKILQQGHPEFEHQSQTNYYLWATGNKKSNGYIYYVNRDNPEQTFTMGFQFDKDLLQQNLNTLNQARNEIYTGLENGTIGRGELYSNLDRYRILADVAPYSDEFQSIKARLANDPSLTKEEQAEISQINERVKQQKEPLRVYPYKFKTSNLQNEKVKVKKVLDNNTLLVDRYGVEHAVKFAGIHVNESNTDKYDKNTTMNEAAAKELKKYIKRGKTITIGYDYDEANKFKKDSTESIRAVVYSNGKNVNQIMLNKGLATEKDKDDSPAAIHARYTKNEIAFGSAMERITHKIGSLPFIGNKFFQVKSPYEQYRDREVYGKDFQSWNNFIRDYLGPEMIDKVMSHGNNGIEGIVTSTVLGTFLGSLFGGSKFGKMIGGFAGGTIGLVGGTYANTQKTKDKDWIPKRREKQAELNEYFDTLKYVKNMSLYEKYKEKALKENHIDVTKLEGTKELQGIYNKNKTNELKDFKKVVKLDYKHRKQFDFKYGAPETLDMDADAKSIIKSINQELTKIQSDRSVERVPENVVKAISYKQQADQTMYGYNVGDPLNNLMKALPKKERQYFKYFMKAPEEEKYKILRIAPEYLKRGLQQAWGMEVDEKPSLQEYFQTHGLPDASWIGWDESTNIEDVKVKLVHNNKLDMGEFDLWNDQINQANQSYIPVPKIRSQNSNRMVQLRLQSILGKAGYEDAVVTPYFNAKGNKNTLNVYQDSRDDISDAINNLDI